MATGLYARDLTPDWQGFCNLWRYVGAHQETYGAPPHYRKTAEFLAAGGYIGAALRPNPTSTEGNEAP